MKTKLQPILLQNLNKFGNMLKFSLKIRGDVKNRKKTDKQIEIPEIRARTKKFHKEVLFLPVGFSSPTTGG